MKKSVLIIDNKLLKIKSISYNKGELFIETSNKYMLNIDLNFDINSLKNNIRENISKKIQTDQNFVTEKYSYVIDIGNDVYLTKNNYYYLLEINNSKVNILIPPYDNINNKRLELNNNYEELEIHKLEAKIYFN